MRRLVSLAAVLAAGAARADETERPPVPEPLFTETVTDIDGREAGEFEFELNGAEWRSLRGGGRELQTTVEGEWLVTRHFGIRGEPFFVHGVGVGNGDETNAYGISLGCSWKLVQDVRHDFYLQAEGAGRVPLTMSGVVEPGESALPLVADLRSALRRGSWTFRANVGVEAGAGAFYAPLRGGLGVFLPFGPSERYGFWGVELDADAARHAPLLVALDLVPNLTSLRLPFKLGFAIPWAVGERENEPALGFFVRLFIESEREIEYGKKSHAE